MVCDMTGNIRRISSINSAFSGSLNFHLENGLGEHRVYKTIENHSDSSFPFIRYRYSAIEWMKLSRQDIRSI